MRRIVLSTLFALLASSTLACAGPPEELMEADRAFDRETLARGLDGWLNWFDPHARLITPKGEVKGAEALRAYYAPMFARKAFSIRWTPVHAEASADATMGYSHGTSVITWTDDAGQPQKREGRYLTVWKKQPGGGWKVVTDLGN